MHSCEALAGAPAQPPPPPASGPALLVQLGRLIVRSRSPALDPRQTKLCGSPSTSQIITQPRAEDPTQPALETALNSHVEALWSEQIPICIEVLLAPDCKECYKRLCQVDAEAAYDKSHAQQRGLLLERWTMRALLNKGHESQAFITSQWLLNAVRSQLHFSQLSAWLQRLKANNEEDPNERRRKLSLEKCNIKKIECNCDAERNLNIIYSIKIPGESYMVSEFTRTPSDHVFPVTDVGNNIYLKVNLESLPRLDQIPTVTCFCQKRRPSISEELVVKLNDLSISSKYPDKAGNCSRRRSIIGNNDTEYLFPSNNEGKGAREMDSKIVDDRMHTPCSENGKHRCNCDEDSDFLNQKEREEINIEKRIKEIAIYKRRLRKESYLKKLSDCSSEGEKKETHTSIPILQAARFDRFRAIGCYRNQTYLTFPATRMETKSAFVDNETAPQEYKRTASISTQTEEIECQCGVKINFKCDSCRTLVRSEANYNLSSIAKDINNCNLAMTSNMSDIQNSEKLHGTVEKNANGDRSDANGEQYNARDETDVANGEKFNTNGLKYHSCSVKYVFGEKCNTRGEPSNANVEKYIANGERFNINDEKYNENGKNKVKAMDKLKCDNDSSNKMCDIVNIVDDSFNNKENNIVEEELIKRPKVRRIFPIVDRIERIVSDRKRDEKDMELLYLKDDDTVFFTPKKLDFPRSQYDKNIGKSKKDDLSKYDTVPNVPLNYSHPGRSNTNQDKPKNPGKSLSPGFSELMKPEAKRQKTFSLNDDDFVSYEKCDLGPFDRCDMDSPRDFDQNGFKFPELSPKSETTNLNDIQYRNSNLPKDNVHKIIFKSNTFETPTYRNGFPHKNPDYHDTQKQNEIHNQNSNFDLSKENVHKRILNSKPFQTSTNRNEYLHKTPDYSDTHKQNVIQNQNSNFGLLKENVHKRILNSKSFQTRNEYDTQKDLNSQNHMNNFTPISPSPLTLNLQNPCIIQDRSKNLDTNYSMDTQEAETTEDSQKAENQVPSPSEMDRFRWRFDSAASMVFHTLTGLPLTSSPAPLRRGNNCFGYDDSINGVSGIKSALFHPYSPPVAPVSPPPVSPPAVAPRVPTPLADDAPKLRIGPGQGLLGTFEESALKGRLEPVATVHGFTAELGASGAFCPPHKKLPVTVFFYAPGGTNAPYLAHINLGSGYRVPRSGTVQVSLFNPHGTLVKMFVVLYDLNSMPACAKTFLRQRTMYMPATAKIEDVSNKWLRYLIHLRFMTSKSGKLYLHTDIRILVSRKADLDTATAHSALFRTNHSSPASQPTNHSQGNPTTNHGAGLSTNRSPNRVFGGCSEFDSEIRISKPEAGCDGQGVSYELRSFTYAPENPRYSPR